VLRNIILKTLRDRRRSLLFWGLGLVALALIMVAFFPVIRDAPFKNLSAVSSSTASVQRTRVRANSFRSVSPILRWNLARGQLTLWAGM